MIILINMKNPMPADAPVCSTLEASKLLGVAVRTVQLWVESGVLQAWKTAGGHRRIARDSLDALLAQRSNALAAGATPATAGDTFRILVVEDDPSLRKLYEMTLASWDLPIAVRTAENGFAGLLQLGEWPPDLLITDLAMPGMDGFRMIEHLRKNPHSAGLEIIVATALDRREVDQRGRLPDGVRVMQKPVPFGELESLVRDRLRSPRAGR